MRKIIACLLLLLCLCSAATAEEISFLPQLTEWSENLPLEVVVSADVKTHMPFDDDRCAQLNALLKHISLRLNTASDGEKQWSRVAVRVDGGEVMSLTQCEAENETLLKLSTQPDVTYTASENGIGGLLGAETVSMYGLDGTEEAWLNDGYSLLSSMGESLEEYKKEATIKTAIKNMGTARKKVTYTIPKADAEKVAAAIAAHCPEGKLRTLLEQFKFSGQQKLILWLNGDGVMIRAEYAGTCGIEDSMRKVSLVWRMRRDESAVRDELSLKTPSVRGNNYNTLTYSRAIVKGKSGKINWDSKFTYTRKFEKEKSTLTGTVDLTNTVSGKKAKVTGTITLKQELSGEDNSTSTKIKPEITITADKISGSVNVQELSGKNVLEDADITLEATAGVFLDEEFAEQSISLDKMTDAQQEAMSLSLAQALLPHLVLLPEEDVLYISADLPEDVWDSLVDAAKSTLEEAAQ